MKQSKEMTKWREKFENNKLARKLIACNDKGIAAVRFDGTVFFATENAAESMWDRMKYLSRIVSIVASDSIVACLRDNGEVIAFDRYGETITFNGEVWENIVEIAVGAGHLVGLKKDGSVIAYGRNTSGQCCVEDWSNISHVYANYDKTYGVCDDGSVVTTADDKEADWLRSLKNVSDLMIGGKVVAITKSNEFFCNADLSFDMKNTIQFYDSYFEGIIRITLYNELEPMLAESSGISTFWAFQTSYKKGVALSYGGTLRPFGYQFTREQLYEIERCICFKKFYIGQPLEERKDDYDFAEKLQNLHWAMSNKEQFEIARIRLEIGKQIQTKERAIERMKEKIDDLSYSRFHFLHKKEIERLSLLVDQYQKMIEDLRKKDPAKEWFGPFAVDVTKLKYDYECALCGRANRLVFVRVTNYGTPEFCCDECLVKLNKYCVVCGEFDDIRSEPAKDNLSYYVCEHCVAKAQDKQAINGEILGQCEKCGAKKVPLWLHGKQLFCQRCHESLSSNE